ncbi:MAG TPA: lysylphosphatidylglycerol synthase domain-containing protein [Motilibacterales bacterium]|nr:lysylphosphatidylglycerol synthase domain-containing protein [Motilibacterales bacterium]
MSVVLVALVGVFLGVALVRNWQAVRSDLQVLSWVDLLASGVAGALAVTCSGMGWRVVLTGLGQRVPVHPALTMFFAGQLGKYVPGSVWTAAIQAELGRRRDIAGSTMLVSYLLALMIAVATGGLVGLLVLVGGEGSPATALWMLLMAAIVGAALARPAWLNSGLAWAFARAGRTPPPIALPGRALAASVAWLMACWTFFGLHAWLLARPLGAGAADLAPTVGAFALAFVAGVLVVPLPAGAGVREGVLVAALAGSIGAPAALTVSLVSRLVLLGVDLVLAGLFGVGGAARAVRARGHRLAQD